MDYNYLQKLENEIEKMRASLIFLEILVTVILLGLFAFFVFSYPTYSVYRDMAKKIESVSQGNIESDNISFSDKLYDYFD